MSTKFQQFLKEYTRLLPQVALIGMNYENDQEVCWDLLTAEQTSQTGSLRNVFNAQQSESLSILQLSSLFDEYQLFPSRKIVSFFSIEKMPDTTKKLFDRYIKILTTSQATQYRSLHFILWTKDPATFSYYAQLLQFKFTISCFEEKASERNIRKTTMLIRKANEAKIQCSLALATHFLKKFSQTDSHTIMQEFQKLLCFIGDKGYIDLADIEKVVEQNSIKSSVWKLRDAIFKRQVMNGIHSVKQLILDQQEHPLRLIEFLRSQCCFGLQLFKNQSFSEKTLIFRSYGKNALMQSLNDLFYTETLLKQNKQTPMVAMQMLVIRMTRDPLSSSKHIRT